MKNWVVYVCLAAILAGAWVSFSRIGRNERIIRRTFQSAVKALEKGEKENPLVAANRADTVASLFVAHPDLPPHPLTGATLRSRTEIRAEVFRVRAMLDSLSIRLDNLAVRIQPDRQTATLTGGARVEASFQGERDGQYQEFEARWVRTREGWKVSALLPVNSDSAEPLPEFP